MSQPFSAKQGCLLNRQSKQKGECVLQAKTIHRSQSQAKKDRRLGLLLVIPIIIIVFGIMGYPFLRAIYLSFTDKLVGMQEKFVGLRNYQKLLSDKIYWKSLTNTLIYTAGCIGAKLVFGMLFALVLNQDFRGKGFFRTLLLIPWAIPGMVAATTWRWMYDSTYGIINSLLISLGMTKTGIAWLSDVHIVLLSTMIVNIWRGIPFFMFSILGALQTLDRQQYEAATVDGAGIFKQFWYITLPSIGSVVGITTLLSTIWTFNDFENVYLLTGGGPLYASSTIATYTYDMAFIQNNFARAMSIAVSVIPILLILIVLYTKANKEEK